MDYNSEKPDYEQATNGSRDVSERPPPSYFSVASTSNPAARANYTREADDGGAGAAWKTTMSWQPSRDADVILSPAEEQVNLQMVAKTSLHSARLEEAEARGEINPWPRGPAPTVGKVFGFAVWALGNYGPMEFIRVVDLASEVIYHFLWPLNMNPQGSGSGTLYMAPNSQVLDNPIQKVSSQGIKLPWSKGPKPNEWTWSMDLSGKSQSMVRSPTTSAPRTEYLTNRCIYKAALDNRMSPSLRDFFEVRLDPAQVNGTSASNNNSSPVWLRWTCSTILRAHFHMRWDTAKYVLHIAGSQKQLATFSFDPSHALVIAPDTELPAGVDHSMIFFTLGALIRYQWEMTMKYPPVHGHWNAIYQSGRPALKWNWTLFRGEAARIMSHEGS